MCIFIIKKSTAFTKIKVTNDVRIIYNTNNFELRLEPQSGLTSINNKTVIRFNFNTHLMKSIVIKQFSIVDHYSKA